MIKKGKRRKKKGKVKKKKKKKEKKKKRRRRSTDTLFCNHFRKYLIIMYKLAINATAVVQCM